MSCFARNSCWFMLLWLLSNISSPLHLTLYTLHFHCLIYTPCRWGELFPNGIVVEFSCYCCCINIPCQRRIRLPLAFTLYTLHFTPYPLHLHLTLSFILLLCSKQSLVIHQLFFSYSLVIRQLFSDQHRQERLSVVVFPHAQIWVTQTLYLRGTDLVCFTHSPTSKVRSHNAAHLQANLTKK